MNAFNMTCEAIEATLPDYLDETLEPWLRAAVQEHLGECVRCAGLVRDLRNIQRDAAAMADLAPSRDLWPPIARRIGTPVVPLAPIAAAPAAPVAGAPTAPIEAAPTAAVAASETAAVPPGWARARYDARASDRHFGAMRMGLAAAALVVVTASTTYLLTVRSLRPTAIPSVASEVSRPAQPAPARPSGPEAAIPETVRDPAPMESLIPAAPMESPTSVATVPVSPPPSSPDSQAATASLASDPVPSSARGYEREVAKLQAIMSWRKAQLNPATAAIVEHNLRIIDGAIEQSKRALQTDPANPMLSDQLTHALDKKVGLLRRAAMLGRRI